MIRSKFTRLTCYAGAAILTAGMAAGCGDDDGGTGGSPDAAPTPTPTADANTGGQPDAMMEACTGHACPDITSAFQLAEGGEFRLERFQTDVGDENDLLAAQAFFFNNQVPAFRGLDGDAVTIRQALIDEGYACGDFRPGDRFDNGTTPEAAAIVLTRDYYDIGETATLTNDADSSEVITLAKAAADGEANVDVSAGLVHPILYKADENITNVTRNAVYTPAITTGSAEYPALDLKFGRSVIGEAFHEEGTGNGVAKLFMPAQFTMTTPTEAEFFDDGGLVFTKGEDLEFEYTKGDEAPADWPNIVPFVGFLDANFKAEGVCFRLPDADGNDRDDGTFTVPSEILEIVSASGGTLIFGRFTHVAWEYQQDKTRIDLLGIECKLAKTITVQENTTGGQ